MTNSVASSSSFRSAAIGGLVGLAVSVILFLIWNSIPLYGEPPPSSSEEYSAEFITKITANWCFYCGQTYLRDKDVEGYQVACGECVAAALGTPAPGVSR